MRFARWPFVTQKLVSRTWKQEESAIRNSRLYLTYGEYYLVQNDLKSAQTEFAHAEALDPNKDEMLGLIASTLLRYEYIDEAARNYARLEKEYPEKIKEYYGYLAFLHYLQDDLQKMTEDIAKGYLQAPEN